ncbi:MAG: ChbG/HpnK family deacetylase [Candidatus Woesearchaeota archaeon]
MAELKQLVVNADDLGMSPSVNRGILFCSQKGIVSSASLMANMPFFNEAVKLKIDFGIHLNLTGGKPLTKAKSLTGSNGEFRGGMIKRLLLGKFDREELREEVNAQILKVKKHVKATHIDSHLHFHVFPFVARIVAEQASNNKIKWIRLPDEPFQLGLGRQHLNLIVLKSFSKKASRLYKQHGLRRADKFYGIADTGRVRLESFKKTLSFVKNGVTEIMCHPGYADRNLKGWLGETRAREVEVLTHPEIKDEIKKLGIKVTSFGGIR